MAQNFLQPKGSINTKVDVSGLEQQLAKMFSAPQTETQPDPLRETVNEIVKTKLLNPVEVPKYTTLNDVLSANKGDKLGVFADFLDNPQTMRTIGTLLGGTYMDRRGNFVHGLEKQAAEREDLMKSEQQKALDEARQQNALAGSVYNAYNQMDIADMNDKRARELAEQELNFKKEQNELDRALQREQMQNSLKIAGIVHSNRGGGGGGSHLTPAQETTIRNNFMKDKAIADYKLISAKTEDINAIKNAFKKSGKLNAADQALIMNFNKTLDPISVVRESEFARTAAGQSLIDRAEGALTKIAKGGSGLSKPERDAIYTVFDVMQDSAKSRARVVAQEYHDLAVGYNANPRNIIMQYSNLLEEDNTPIRQQAPKGKLRL